MLLLGDWAWILCTPGDVCSEIQLMLIFGKSIWLEVGKIINDKIWSQVDYFVSCSALWNGVVVQGLPAGILRKTEDVPPVLQWGTKYKAICGCFSLPLCKTDMTKSRSGGHIWYSLSTLLAGRQWKARLSAQCQWVFEAPANSLRMPKCRLPWTT